MCVCVCVCVLLEHVCVCMCVYVCVCVCVCVEREREWHCNGSVLIQLDPHSHIQLTLLHKELCSHSLNLIRRYFNFVLIKSVIDCVTMVSASKVFITFVH